MKTICKNFLYLFLFVFSIASTAHAQNNDNRIRIIMIGAHPDDCDQDGGGTAILFAKMGYAVKFVSITNGDAGHQAMKGTELAKRRYAEAQEAAIRAQALQAFRVLGGRGWGRVDFLMDEAGQHYFLEANMSPGLTDHSLVPRGAKAAGISFDELVLKVLALATVAEPRKG